MVGRAVGADQGWWELLGRGGEAGLGTGGGEAGTGGWKVGRLAAGCIRQECEMQVRYWPPVCQYLLIPAAVPL